METAPRQGEGEVSQLGFAAFPDGIYKLRVTATDTPDNPPGQALTNQIESDPFMIDNTAPQITSLTGSRSGNQVVLRWKAKDGLSVMDQAEYSLDGGDWQESNPPPGSQTHLSWITA